MAKPFKLMLLATALCIASAPALVMASPDDGWQGVVRCADSRTAELRHACIDQVLREQGVLTREKEAAAEREAFGARRPAPTASPVPPVVAQGPATPARPIPTPADLPGPEATRERASTLVTEIARVEQGADRKLIIITAEGAIWRQLETVEMRGAPRKGDAFTIEQAALGSYRCRIGRSLIFRCSRQD